MGTWGDRPGRQGRCKSAELSLGPDSLHLPLEMLLRGKAIEHWAQKAIFLWPAWLLASGSKEYCMERSRLAVSVGRRPSRGPPLSPYCSAPLSSVSLQACDNRPFWHAVQGNGSERVPSTWDFAHTARSNCMSTASTTREYVHVKWVIIGRFDLKKGHLEVLVTILRC